MGWTVGLELAGVGVEQRLILFGRFLLESNAGGVETVGEGVPGGFPAACFSFGAVRFCAVGEWGNLGNSRQTLRKYSCEACDSRWQSTLNAGT
jgi:hypothetical protein